MSKKCPKCNTEWPDSVVHCPRDGERIMYIQTGVEVVDDVAPIRRVSQVGRMRLVAPKASKPGIAAEMTPATEATHDKGSGQDEAAQRSALEAEFSREAGGARGMVVRSGSQPGMTDESDEITSEPGLPEEAGGAADPPSGARTAAGGPLVPAALKVGDQLGSYELMGVLGEGGMGTVFIGEHTVLKRRDALKVLLPEFCSEPSVVKRFFHEARAVNLIHHPNIIDIKDFVEGDDHPPYMVMEYIDGESLSHYIRHNAPIAPDTVVAIATQICSALQAVHDQGIVHRDLKPDNVLLQKELNSSLKAKLLDFGVAKFIGGQETFLKTLSGAAVGTPEFMAPEQIVGEKVDHRIDIYALGVILYEMLTSRQPFSATTVGELVTAHLTAEPVPPAQRLAELDAEPIPPELNDTVLRCLAKEADDRVGSMEALRKMLRVGIGEVTSPLPVPALEDLGRRPSKRSRLGWILGGVAVLALAALGAVLGFGLVGGGPKRTGGGASGDGATKTGTHATMRAAPMGAQRKVWVTSVPGGASLFCRADGRFLGKTPTSVLLKQGERMAVRLRLNGYLDSRAEVGYDATGPLRVVLASTPSLPDNAMAATGSGMQPPDPMRSGMRPTMRPGMRPVVASGMRPAVAPDMRPMGATTMGGMRDLGGTLDPFGMSK